MKEKCWSKSDTQLSFKYFMNSWLILKLFLKVWKVQTAAVQEMWFLLPKLFDYFGDISLTKAIFRKIIEGEMLIKVRHTTLFQIFYEFMINSEVIFKSMEGPDGCCPGDVISAAKTVWLFWWYLSNKSNIQKNNWRRNVDQSPTHNSPSNILWIND